MRQCVSGRCVRAPVEEGTACMRSSNKDDELPGTCEAGVCELVSPDYSTGIGQLLETVIWARLYHLGSTGVIHCRRYAMLPDTYRPCTVIARTIIIDGAVQSVGEGFEEGVSGPWQPCQPGACVAGHGGSHGGEGGAVTGGACHTPYDSVSVPWLPGAAGVSCSGTEGAAGGGGVRLLATGSLVVNGSIDVSGGDGAYGGAGGSIVLRGGGGVHGTGLLRANGGAGTVAGGGGGRISIHGESSLTPEQIVLDGGDGPDPGQPGVVYPPSESK
ncbi:MAG: hypothetical protein ACI9WU_002431 [Myxococcota bacterium]